MLCESVVIHSLRDTARGSRHASGAGSLRDHMSTRLSPLATALRPSGPDADWPPTARWFPKAARPTAFWTASIQWLHSAHDRESDVTASSD
jgi:hypothetical protein